MSLMDGSNGGEQDVAILRGSIVNVLGHVVATMTGYLTLGKFNQINRQLPVIGFLNVVREKTTYGFKMDGRAIGQVMELNQITKIDGITLTGSFPNISISTSNSTTSGKCY
jgi:hypothetical protein